MAESTDEFIPTRHSLLVRLKNWDDQESWRDFFNTYWKLIYSVARKSGLADAEAQDVVQEVVLSVAKKMGEFKYDPKAGSFKGWLLLITRRRIADHLRKVYRSPRLAQPDPAATSQTGLIERVADPESLDLDAVWESEWQNHLMTAAIERVKQQVSARQFEIFEAYVLRELPVQKVVDSLGVSATQVYLAKHRISSLLKKELRNLDTKAT